MTKTIIRSAGSGATSVHALHQGIADGAKVRQLLAQGRKLEAKGRRKDAMQCFQDAIQVNPASAEAFRCLGAAYWHEGQLVTAAAMWLRATELEPGEASAHTHLGVALRGLGRLQEAEAAHRRALELNPSLAIAYGNLSVVLRDQGRFVEGEAACRRAIELDDRVPEHHAYLGIVLEFQGRVEEAITAYRRALELAPDSAEIHKDFSIALLKAGHLAEGWNEYEWRWRSSQTPRTFGIPMWNGEDLHGCAILLHAEQGLGDAIQFVRFAKLMKARGARVVIEVPEPLRRLLATVPGVDEVVTDGSAREGANPWPLRHHLPMLSAPRLLQTTLASIPAEVPYVFPDAAAVDVWAESLRRAKGPKVGLVWAGDPRQHNPRATMVDRRRSIPLVALSPLLSMPDVTFVSLQKGGPAQQVDALPRRLRPLDMMDRVSDFADTAGLVANLDLVISADTSVAHLAGAMAKPVWILSRLDGCWRWLLDRDDSPWYPTARLFRQTEPGNWDTVIAQVTAALGEFVKTRRR